MTLTTLMTPMIHATRPLGQEMADSLPPAWAAVSCVRRVSLGFATDDQTKHAQVELDDRRSLSMEKSFFYLSALAGPSIKTRLLRERRVGTSVKPTPALILERHAVGCWKQTGDRECFFAKLI